MLIGVSLQSAGPQPRVRDNDYGSLSPPALDGWAPHLPVSVVIPAYGAQHKLDLTLAALAAQTYPARLLEVVIADDGSDPPLRLPGIRPERTRIVPSRPGGWGCGHAYHSGVLAADGDVIVRLDADMVTFHDHVAAQVRWHHLADHLVVVGRKRFVDYEPGTLTPREVHDTVARGAADRLFDNGQSRGHPFDAFIARTDRLRSAGAHASRVFTGATSSYHRAFYHHAGGVDGDMILGEDIEFGYRLGQAGAVFIPELASGSWHLGWSTTMTDRDRATRYCRPFYANRVLTPRSRRPDPGRQWRVPGVQIVMDVATATWEEVRATVNGLAAGLVSDFRVDLAGPWSRIHDGRCALLDDPMLELRLMRECFGDDGRVRLVESVPETAFPTPYRFRCPPGWVPAPEALHRLIGLVERAGYGTVVVTLPGDDAPTARLEQTRAYARAHRVRGAGEDIDDVVHEMFGVHTVDGAGLGVVRAGGAEPAPPVDWPAEAAKWRAEAGKWRDQANRLRRNLQALQARHNRAPHRRIRRAVARRLPAAVRRRLRRVLMTRRRLETRRCLGPAADEPYQQPGHRRERPPSPEADRSAYGGELAFLGPAGAPLPAELPLKPLDLDVPGVLRPPPVDQDQRPGGHRLDLVPAVVPRGQPVDQVAPDRLRVAPCPVQLLRAGADRLEVAAGDLRPDRRGHPWGVMAPVVVADQDAARPQ
jgi:glycosyltransferase involved in cell wall biosynthesis